MTEHPDIFRSLAAPFRKEEVKTRPQGKASLSYVTARTVMNRLDEVLGPENWWDDYTPMTDGVMCRLTIRLPDGATVTKSDAGGYAGMTDSGDDEKSGFSDAFKRAAVKFGVGRYLYRDGTAQLPDHHAAHHDNRSGHGVGAYAAPGRVTEYQDWLRATCDEINAKWLDHLTDKATGEFPAKAPAEIVSTWQLSGHLLKWGKSKGWVEAPEDVRPGQRDKFAALLMVGWGEAMRAEALDYCRKQWSKARDKLAAPSPVGASHDSDVWPEGRE